MLQAEHALASLSEIIVKYDDDGIDIHFLNYRSCNLRAGQWNEVKRTNLKVSSKLLHNPFQSLFNGAEFPRDQSAL